MLKRKRYYKLTRKLQVRLVTISCFLPLKKKEEEKIKKEGKKLN